MHPPVLTDPRPAQPLDGCWQFSPADGPARPESLPTGLAWQDWAGQPLPQPCYLRRRVLLAELSGRRAWVRLERTGGESVFFLNGRRFYASAERILPVEFDITDHTDQPDNDLIAWIGPGCAPGPAALIYAPAVSLPDLAARASHRQNSLEVDVTLENRTLAPARAGLRLTVFDGQREVLQIADQLVELDAGALTTLRFACAWPSARRWSPASPQLYRLRASLEPGDLREIFFGFREIWRAHGGWRLNGQPLNLEQLDTLDGPPPDPRLLDAADASGRLLLAGYTAGAAPGVEQDHLVALLRRDRSHACLLAWRMDVPAPLRALLTAFDPSRPILPRLPNPNRAG